MCRWSRREPVGHLGSGVQALLWFNLQKQPGRDWIQIIVSDAGSPNARWISRTDFVRCQGNTLRWVDTMLRQNPWWELHSELGTATDPYDCYLNRDQLLEGSRLSESDLWRLEEYRLIVPDTKDGRYRPKLVGWGKKLAYLLREGWEVDAIKRWSRDRWKSKNPRE